MSKEENNHTRNQKRMYRIHKQEERIQDLELLVGTLQQENTQLKESKQKLDKIKELIKFKNAWEELKQSYEKVFKECKTENDYIICGMSGISGVLEFISELEQKHGIEVE